MIYGLTIINDETSGPGMLNFLWSNGSIEIYMQHSVDVGMSARDRERSKGAKIMLLKLIMKRKLS